MKIYSNKGLSDITSDWFHSMFNFSIHKSIMSCCVIKYLRGWAKKLFGFIYFAELISHTDLELDSTFYYKWVFEVTLVRLAELHSCKWEKNQAHDLSNCIYLYNMQTFFCTLKKYLMISFQCVCLADLQYRKARKFLKLNPHKKKFLWLDLIPSPSTLFYHF